MPTPTQINATTQFNQFVDFAQLAMKDGNTKAIAREGVAFTASDGTTILRTVGAATGDKVYAIRRSRDNKQANDAARALFKKAVGDMFGGESRIPPSVLKAMNMKDYGCGKPLTARRIMAVKTAIDNIHVEPVIKSITHQVAATKISHAVEFAKAEDARMHSQYPLTITTTQQKLAEDLLCKHGKNMTEAGLNVLAANLVRLVSIPALAGRVDGYAARIAMDISTNRNFEPGDARLKDVDATFFTYAKDWIEEYIDMSDSSKEIHGDLHDTFSKDGARGDYTIAGKRFNAADDPSGKYDPSDMIAAFKSVVTKPNHRKVLSAVMNQAFSVIPAGIMMGIPLAATKSFKNGLDPLSVSGSELIVRHPPTAGIYLGYGAANINEHFAISLEMAQDGKRATITCTFSGQLNFDIHDGTVIAASVGKYAISQELTFDLSGDDPKLLEYHLGQSFSA